MRSVILSFTVLSALAAAPALAQMTQVQGQQDQSAMLPNGELPAPPQHVPVVNHPTNLTPQDTRSTISPALPQPPVGPNADATQYLQAAQAAVQSGRLGEAQSALEDAETWLLNRSVPLGAVNQPDPSPAVNNINQALQALANHDRGQTLALIQQTIPMTQQMAMQGGGMGAGMNGGMGQGTMPQPGAMGAPAGSPGTGYGYTAPPPATH
ncbi:MAG TPA: hypothetical protein VFA03_03845 [Acetobacteraceae bacterium]|nr:hypothetical protein [Acetobacteraceae bacterium]